MSRINGRLPSATNKLAYLDSTLTGEEQNQVLDALGGASSIGGPDQSNKLLKLNNEGYIDDSALAPSLFSTSGGTTLGENKIVKADEDGLIDSSFIPTLSYVSNSVTINGRSLDSNVTLTADDIGVSTNTLISSAQVLTDESITQVHKNLKVRRHEVTTFTPVTTGTAPNTIPGTGWYRIIQHDSVIGCVLRITSNDETLGRTTDAEVSIHVDKDTRGVMNQTRHSTRKGGHVSMLRVARNQNGLVVVDIHISTEGTQITLEAEGLLFPGFVPTISRLVNQTITDNETNLVDDLPLANGLRSTGAVASHLGSSRDPGTSLAIQGRAAYLHSLSLTAGNSRFTGASDHFHMFFRGAGGSGSGSRTAQGGSAWDSFQMQNSNSSLTNDIFLGGVTAFFYGENEFAPVDSITGATIKYGISTDRVETTGSGDGSGYLGPVAPDFTAEVDFWFTSDVGLPTTGTIMANFPTGVAGISAAILPGIIKSKTLETIVPDGIVPDGSTTSKWRLRVKLYGLNAIEWKKESATPFSPSVVWRLSTTPNAVVGNQSLAVHPTRRDKVLATFNAPHGLFVGQVMVLRLAERAWGVSAGSYSGCITKIISENSFEMKVGIVRQENPFEAGAREYLSIYGNPNSLPANVLRIPSHNFSNGEAVRVRAIGQLQTGLFENTTYYVKKHGGQPAHWIYLYSDPALTSLVTFTSANKFGIYTIYTEAHPAELGTEDWSIHRGNRDPVHQQTISDVGWRMNRNVFGDRRGLAAGTIAQVTLGGLCDIPYWITGSLAAGFNSSAEADFSYSLGKDLRNVTPQSVEIGVDDSFKLRVTSDKASLITGGVESQLITATDVLPALQGAAGDPTRIGEEYFPNVLTPSALVLADLSSVVAPLNTLAYKGGMLARHDGVTVGGNVVSGGTNDSEVLHTQSRINETSKVNDITIFEKFLSSSSVHGAVSFDIRLKIHQFDKYSDEYIILLTSSSTNSAAEQAEPFYFDTENYNWSRGLLCNTSSSVIGNFDSPRTFKVGQDINISGLAYVGLTNTQFQLVNSKHISSEAGEEGTFTETNLAWKITDAYGTGGATVLSDVEKYVRLHVSIINKQILFRSAGDSSGPSETLYPWIFEGMLWLSPANALYSFSNVNGWVSYTGTYAVTASFTSTAPTHATGKIWIASDTTDYHKVSTGTEWRNVNYYLDCNGLHSETKLLIVP